MLKKIREISIFLYLKLRTCPTRVFNTILKLDPSRVEKYLILFAGRYYNGNLKSVYEELKRQKQFNGKPYEMSWVTRSWNTLRKFQRNGVKPLWFFGLENIPLFLKAHIWVNDRGEGDIPVGKIQGSLWVQVGHGIPFKGYAGDKKVKETLNTFDLHPVSSEWLRDYYINEIGISPEKVVVTGYPRIDRLVNSYYHRDKVIKELGLVSNQPIILYAPTWQHESEGEKPLFPFGNDIRTLKKLTLFLEENSLQLLIRLHPNWGGWCEEMTKIVKESNRIICNSVKTDWDTEKYLYISDILVTDWSSIANDFIVLNRPMIFFENSTVFFKYGFTVKPEDRAGILVKTEDAFLKAILRSIEKPEEYEEKREKLIKKIHFKMDGKASKRVVREMEKYMAQVHQSWI